MCPPRCPTRWRRPLGQTAQWDGLFQSISARMRKKYLQRFFESKAIMTTLSCENLIFPANRSRSCQRIGKCDRAGQFASLPGFNLSSHRLNVTLHAVNANRESVEREPLRVFCEHMSEHTWDSVFKFTGPYFPRHRSGARASAAVRHCLRESFCAVCW
jgi:hypothetical protein